MASQNEDFLLESYQQTDVLAHHPKTIRNKDLTISSFFDYAKTD